MMTYYQMFLMLGTQPMLTWVMMSMMIYSTLEAEWNWKLMKIKKNTEPNGANDGLGLLNGTMNGEHPYGEHPS
jgi:hypothetical protein